MASVVSLTLSQVSARSWPGPDFLLLTMELQISGLVLPQQQNSTMRHFLYITTLLLALLPPGSPQTMEAYNTTEEVEEAESFFSSMDFHVSQSVALI